MTPQEEYEKILKIRNKEISFDEAVKSYKGMLVKKSKSYHIAGQDKDDLYSCSMYSLYKAVNTFDGSGSFIKYLGYIIDNDFKSMIRKSWGERNGDIHYTNCARLNKPVAAHVDGNFVEMGELLPTNLSLDCLDYNLLIPIVKEAMIALPPEVQKLLQLHLFEECNQQEIAKEFGVLQSTISRRIQRSLLLLQKELEKLDITNPYPKQ
jgi:RNA polymerase sigma factor (sigma-70 family)